MYSAFTKKMNVDQFSVIGHSHKVCQDYILSGQKPFPYIILSDGCSGSPDTDLGARVLCHKALEWIEKNQRRIMYMKPDLLGDYLSSVSEELIGQFAVPIDALDATLIIAFYYDVRFHIVMFGDGAICSLNPQGEYDHHRVEYRPNMPAYLRYRKHGYIDYRRQNVIQSIDTWRGNKVENDPFKPYYVTFPQDEVKSLLVASDGIESFTYKEQAHYKGLYFSLLRHLKDMGGNFHLNDMKNTSMIENAISDSYKAVTPELKELDYLELMKEIMQFKKTNGIFLQRRMKKILKQHSKFGYVNDDDLTIGCFYTEDE